MVRKSIVANLDLLVMGMLLSKRFRERPKSLNIYGMFYASAPKGYGLFHCIYAIYKSISLYKRLLYSASVINNCVLFRSSNKHLNSLFVDQKRYIKYT